MSEVTVTGTQWLLGVQNSGGTSTQQIARSENLEELTQYAERILRYKIGKVVTIRDASTATSGATIDPTVKAVYAAAVKAHEYGVVDLPLIPTLEQKVRFAANDLKHLTGEQ